MRQSPLVLIANATDHTISAYALRDDVLEPLATTPLPGSCSTFAVDAARDLVYAGVKGDPPAVLTLRLDRTSGVLTEIARRAAPAAPTYLTLTPDGGLLLGASYSGHWGGVWPVADGRLGAPADHVSFPRLHCVTVSGDARHAYFVSLGDDLVAQYDLAPDGGLTPLDPPTVAAPAGSGPRHLILDAAGRAAYLITEFSGEVVQLARDAAGRLAPVQAATIFDPDAGLQRSRLGADPRAENLIWGADVHLAGGGRFVLASERTAGTIATLAVDADGGLGALVALRATEAQPRGFAVTADGSRVVVVGELATDAALYRVEDDGSLSDLHHVDAGRGANWVRVLEPTRPAERTATASGEPAATEPDLARPALQQAGDAIIVVNTRGIIREWNDTCVALFGFTAEQALGQDVKLIIPERLRDAHDRGFLAAMEAGHLRSDGRPRRTKGLTADGGTVYVTMSFAVVNDDEDAVRPAIGSVAVARTDPERPAH